MTCGYFAIGHRKVFPLQKSANATNQDFFSPGEWIVDHLSEHHCVLAKASQKASLGSRGRETDFTSCLEELESYITRDMIVGRVIIVAIFPKQSTMHGISGFLMLFPNPINTHKINVAQSDTTTDNHILHLNRIFICQSVFTFMTLYVNFGDCKGSYHSNLLILRKLECRFMTFPSHAKQVRNAARN